jgi:ADP-ribose pyrophosphatase
MPRVLRETFLRSKARTRGHAVDFRIDEIRLPNGKSAWREYLDHPGAVGVLPFLDPATVVLVRQYRYPVGETTLEIPAGKLDAGESPLPCVRRELAEETGYRARRIRPLLRFWPTPAFANEVLHLYVAEGLVAGPRRPDEDEFLDVVVLPLREALSLVRRSKIMDSKTVIALLAWAGGPRRGRQQKDYTIRAAPSG